MVKPASVYAFTVYKVPPGALLEPVQLIVTEPKDAPPTAVTPDGVASKICVVAVPAVDAAEARYPVEASALTVYQ